MQFEYPWILYLLWLVPAAGLGWLAVARRREQALARLVALPMQARLRPGGSRARPAAQAACMLSGLFLALLAAARPQWGARDEVVFRRGRDLVIALDVSRSMLADDVRPSRLARAKADLMDLIRDLRGDRAALVAFRHKAVLLCPLTTDYGFLRQALDGADIGSAPRGETDLGAAIRASLDAFQSRSASHKAVILISDGEDLQGNALAAAAEAAERGIPIFTVGIGAREGSRIPDPGGDGAYATYQGKPVVTRLDHETLLAVARKTQGAYVPLERASTATTTLGTLYREHLRKIAARDLEESLRRRHIDRFPLFLLPAVLLLTAGAGLSRGRLASGRVPADPQPPPSPAAPAVKDLNPPQREIKQL
ncbi:MAG: VWA domain-containing protein [Lentisphaerae bacterium]|nr:VWA domain-containing protein [Lentisphaerota bacterium]